MCLPQGDESVLTEENGFRPHSGLCELGKHNARHTGLQCHVIMRVGTVRSHQPPLGCYYLFFTKYFQNLVASPEKDQTCKL